ncbi:glutaredoxin [Turkeypox virus]|uniref:Glutaredoxin-2 n=1 Tax=Turkeypox virus TaxID=336486 RepID=A0A0M5HX39_9POXV|nr:glutaredoxin [Turkeypox virus]ALA62425.1 glutaredoxin [Turkeypox virus]
MKETIILFGKPACTLCKLANEILSDDKISNRYNITRINILTFFINSKVVEVLGMNSCYDMIKSIGEKFGNEYVLVFKYAEDTKQMAYIDFKKYLVIGQMAYQNIDFNQLLLDIESAPYNVLLTDK